MAGCAALLPPYGSTVLQVGLSGASSAKPNVVPYGQCWASAAEAGVSPTYAAAVVGRVTTRLRCRPWRDALRYSRPTVLQVGLSGLHRQSPTSCPYGQCWASADKAGVSPTYAAAVAGRVTTRLRSRPWRDALRYSRPTVLRFCRLG